MNAVSPAHDPRKDVHRRLQCAYDLIHGCRDSVETLSNDTVFALGEALGTVAKVRALVGRDIDEAEYKR